MTARVIPTPALGPMPRGRRMCTIDERLVRAPVARIFALARDVAAWPALLPHYRWVDHERASPDGGGIVGMSANRPFGPSRWPVQWPTRWRSLMAVDEGAPSIRFRHIGGITTGMDVEWTFHATATAGETRVRIVHVWDGPPWPLIGTFTARRVIGPVFVHGIASRTLAGLATIAERAAETSS